jgi:hypothetical protein
MGLFLMTLLSNALRLHENGSAPGPTTQSYANADFPSPCEKPRMGWLEAEVNRIAGEIARKSLEPDAAKAQE